MSALCTPWTRRVAAPFARSSGGPYQPSLLCLAQYLNIKLENTRVVDEARFPHMKSVRNCFIRGSVVRYVQLPREAVDVDILHDATRREARGA